MSDICVPGPWCPIHYPDNRVKVRWNAEAERWEWRARNGRWTCFIDGELIWAMQIAHKIAKNRARDRSPISFEAWDRSQHERP